MNRKKCRIRKNDVGNKVSRKLREKKGTVCPMEMVQVAILIALAIAIGLIFKTEITEFVNKTFENLNG